MEAIEKGKYQADLKKFADNIEPPKAILSISAHWERSIPILITSSKIQKTIHDFYGFPEELYQLDYSVPGLPKLAKEIAFALKKHDFNVQLTARWGLDHGTWVPLMIMFPEKNIPVLQLSIPIPRTEEELFQIGRVLRQFRERGILIMGSGGVTHNLSLAMMNVVSGNSSKKPDSWAEEFDRWVKETLETNQPETLLKASNHPLFRIAAPTTEHFDPIYFVIGALYGHEGIRTVHESIKYGNLSMRTFASEY